MSGRVLVRRIVAAADVAAAAADPQMQPLASAFQTLLAAERARRDGFNAGDMAAAFCRHHTSLVPSEFISTPRPA
jgi:hypothetical protein